MLHIRSPADIDIDRRIVSTFWLVHPANDRCIPVPTQNGITFALNAMNACTDWILGTLPFFMVKNLNLSFGTKIMVAGLLAFAALYVMFAQFPNNISSFLPSGSTGTIVRMKYVKNLTNGPEFLCKLPLIALRSATEACSRCDYRCINMVNSRAWDRHHGCKYRNSASPSANSFMAAWLRTAPIIRHGPTNKFARWEIQSPV